MITHQKTGCYLTINNSNSFADFNPNPSQHSSEYPKIILKRQEGMLSFLTANPPPSSSDEDSAVLAQDKREPELRIKRSICTTMANLFLTK